MTILALDFSSPQRSVAVLNCEGLVLSEQVDASTGRDMRPFALIESALRAANLEREAIDCVAVGIGPGSYTGIRVGISLAQGWQLATGVKVLGISSVECVAQQAGAMGISGRFHVVIDAQRRECYVADYEWGQGVAKETNPLRLMPETEVRALAQSGAMLIGPEVTRWIPDGIIVSPQAATLGRLARMSSDFIPGEKLEPIYLRETTFVKAPPPRVIPGVTGG